MDINNISVQVDIVEGDYGPKAIITLWSPTIADFRWTTALEDEELGTKIVNAVAEALEAQ